MVDFSKGTVISSRIRLARNINGYPFPGRLSNDRNGKEIIRSVTSAANRVGDFRLVYMDGISEDDAVNLVENRLISPALLNTPSRSAVLINDSKDVSVMINEEDHLREQCISSKLSLREAYEKLSAIDTAIGRSLPFSYDEQLGYLTACPTNLGTGLRASVMLFLPALELGGMMEAVVKSATRLGLTVRGAYGEGSSAEGFTYQVSNEVTLGITEEKILTQVEAVVKKIIEMEAAERESLRVGANALKLKDACLRAYGVLTHCALMSGEEFDGLCADLKVGACLGFINIDDLSAVDEIMLKMKPSNINVMSGRTLSASERDAYRAQYASRIIKELVKE